MDHFRYFMIRVRLPSPLSTEPAERPLSGIIESLGSGDKRDFASEEELLQLMVRWSARWPGVPVVGPEHDG